MIDTKSRDKFQPIFDNLAKPMLAIGMTPNQVTVIAFVLGIASALCISMNAFVLAFVFLWLSGLMDVLDGTLARLSGRSSPKGAYMDLVFDRLVEAFVILGFYFSHPEGTLAYLLFYIAVIFNFTTFMLAGTLFKNEGKKSMHYDIGLAERTETFIFFSIMFIWVSKIQVILLVFDLIILMTGVIRFYRIMHYQDE